MCGQSVVKFAGFLTDTTDGNPIENAAIQIGKERPQISDDKGFFTNLLKPGHYQITVKHVGYKQTTYRVDLTKDTIIQLKLFPASHLLSETNVTNRREQKSLSGLSGGRFELDMEQLKALPKFMGNNDPMKILQLLPGVQTAGEGNSGIFIRGGEPGHNLITWNDAPIYNASHLLGAFSIFNTNHIGSFKLHKSNMNADFGGRLSALIEVSSPDRIPEKVSVSGDIGLISSQATLAVPMGKKTALYLSGRKTYVGLTLKPLLRTMVSEKGKDMPFDYEFGDCNLTLVNRPTDQDKIILNAYWGMDQLDIEDPDYSLDGNMKWWNLATSLSWEHRWSSQTVLKNSVFFSQYQNKLDIVQNSLSAHLPSQIRDLGFRNKLHFKWGRVNFKTGVDYTFHILNPQSPQIRLDSDSWGNSEQQTYYTHDIALFLCSQFQITNRLSAELSFRYALNLQTGPYDDLTYDIRGGVIDSTHYGRGTPIDSRHSPEPRLALRYTLTENSQIQVSYNRQKQWINLVSISGVGLPTDFWIPASKHIPPQTGDNFSGGYFQSLYDNQYEFSIEGYYREMQQQMEFKSALFDLFNQQYILEESINYGKGKAYGAEFIVKKNTGRFNGWISYTLGWSKRNFPAIMNGTTFPAKHDRRHDLSLVGSYKLNDKWDFSTVFVYATGSCFTMPTGMYMMGGNVVKEYGKYNGSRLPDYHRLDLSANYWFFKRKDKESGLNFSIYNVYKRSNPLYIFIMAKPSTSTENQIIIQKKKKRLYDIIPSVSWTFRF